MPGSKPLVVRWAQLQKQLHNLHSQDSFCTLLLGAEQLPQQRQRRPRQRPRCHKTARNRHGRWVRLPRPVHRTQEHRTAAIGAAVDHYADSAKEDGTSPSLPKPVGALVDVIEARARVSKAEVRVVVAEAKIIQLQEPFKRRESSGWHWLRQKRSTRSEQQC